MGHGHFSSEPEAVWLTEDGTPDRRMKILHDFSFTDPRSRVWEAPAGSVVDGASIPRALWTVVGTDVYMFSSQLLNVRSPKPTLSSLMLKLIARVRVLR